MSAVENPITTSSGTRVHVTTRRETGDRVVMLEAPAAPKDLRWCEAGRLHAFGGNLGFQPAPFAAWALSPEVLRAIAELIECEGQAKP